MTRWLWTGADGAVTDLSDWGAGSYVTDDLSGLLAPAYVFETEQAAGVDGAALQDVTPQPRTTTLGLDLTVPDEAALRARLRALAHTLRPRAGMGSLTAVAADGTSRTLPCYYSKGLEGGTYKASRYRTVLEFWAESPWWRGDPWSIDYGLAAPAAFFPILPLRLASTTIAGSATVDLSDTDSPTFPQWVITGPGDQLTLRNETTGAVLILNAPIGDGQLVVIDTRPGRQSVYRATPGASTWVEQRRQLVPNPDVGSSTAWFVTAGTGGTATGARVASGWPTGGGAFYRGTYTAATTNGAGTGSQAAVVADGRQSSPLPIPVTPGVPYTGAIEVRPSVDQLLEGRVQWYDAANALVSQDGGGGVVVPAGTAVRLTVPAVACPAGAAYARVAAIAPSGAGAVPFGIGATFDAARAQLEQAEYVGQTPGDYFSGATPDVGAGTLLGDVNYAWTAAADASPSTLSVVSAVGDPILGASLFGSLASDPAMWALVDGVQSITALLTNAGAASRITATAERLFSGAL